MVITAVPLAGFMPNILRKLLALRLIRPDEDFDATTERLLAAFSPHLATINGMTRSHRDWVHDCMMNPHYLHVALPFDTLLDAMGDGMEVLATSPRFAPDWRWFKSMTGAGRSFNDHLLAGELADLHNFMDCRKVLPRRQPDDNTALALALRDGYRAALTWQDAHGGDDADALAAAGASVSGCLQALTEAFATIDPATAAAFKELQELWESPDVTAQDVASLDLFAQLFGRETVYVSLTRTADHG